MTASVYGQTHESFLCQENVGAVAECLRIAKCELFFLNFSSEAEHVLALFLFFGQI